jgi:DNA-binding transcriptional LysR family regulator
MEVIRQVERGQVQLGLVGRQSDSPHLEFRYLASDQMILVVPAKHPWARRKEVTLEQLCKQPLILRESGSGLRHGFERELERLGKSVRDLQIALELGSNEAIKKAVLQGAGLAILSSYSVKRELKSKQLRALRVTSVSWSREMFVTWDRRRVLPGPAQLFRIFLESRPISKPAP